MQINWHVYFWELAFRYDGVLLRISGRDKRLTRNARSVDPRNKESSSVGDPLELVVAAVVRDPIFDLLFRRLRIGR